MLHRKAFKFRLKTNKFLENIFAQKAGCNRLVWNKALALQKELLDKNEHCLSYYKLAPLLKEWKDSEEFAFLKDCPAQSLQQTLMSLDRAIKDAFNKKSPKRFPRFKKKGQSDSFRYPQGIKIKNKQIFLPKIGWIGFFKSRNIVGQIKNATVSRRGKYWFVSIQTEQEVKVSSHPSQSMVGLDVGIKRFATLSDGTVYQPLNSFKKLSKKLCKEQRSLSKKQRGSNNFKKQKLKVSSIHAKISNARLDYLHKVSTIISKNHACVVLEDLKISNMSSSAKGTKEKPGKNVKAKAGLNRSILDQGWFTFKELLKYKQCWLGGEVISVDAKYTSQKCSECGHTERDNRTTQARFGCQHCGLHLNADLNAALNLLTAGHAVLACGELGLPSLLKQEPLAANKSTPVWA